MEISEIKQRLTIHQVLDHYGLKSNRNKMLHCPFHEDKTPSMQVYPDTNTVFCFSSNCKLNGKAIDQVDFILHKESEAGRTITKHEAIEKAKHLINAAYQSKTNTMQKDGQDLVRIAVLSKLMYEAKESLNRSERGKDYCAARGLDPKQIEMGFLAERFYHSWNEKLKQSAIEIGIIKELKNKSLSPVFRNCLIFPMKNKEGKPVGIYGRSITGNSSQRHFYLKGKHQGLYPKYPIPETQKLIITESIIDAATLLQLPEITTQYEILALYGTNGLTEEHKAAIQSLQELQEIIFLLDGDEAGNKAVKKYSKELHSLFRSNSGKLVPKVKISKGEIPTGEDVNSLLIGHEPEIMNHVLAKRTLLFSSNESSNEKGNLSAGRHESSEPKADQAEPTLNTSNPEKITWEGEVLKITIWGGIEYGNLHRLKLSLYLEHKGNGYSFRDDVNLYSNRSRKGFMQDASGELDIPESELKEIITAFTKAVETWRLKRKEEKKTLGKPEAPKLNSLEQREAVSRLKNKHLITNLKGAMQKAGLIGEADNGLLLFLIFLTRFFDNPLHALVHGSSGSGKTNLLKTILGLVPEESKYITTALTENVLFRPPHKDFWKNKILLLEDLDGSYKALYPLREFMSNQEISKFVSEPDPKTGQFRQVLLEAHGPIVIAGATTKDKVYEDNSNRSFLLHVDESADHQNQILEYQNKQAAGLIDSEGIEATCRKIHNIQRMLNPKLKVINPFQPQLKLPEYVFKKLRTNTHYITLIQAITFLHQYQREKKKNERGQLYIETTLEDVALANALSKHSLLRKSDELNGQVRNFFESLKALLKQDKQDTFLSAKIRERMRMHPMKFNRRISELRQRGYLKQVGGNRKTGYEYQVTIWDDYQVLQKGLAIMDEVLDKLRKQYPDGKYSKAEV